MNQSSVTVKQPLVFLLLTTALARLVTLGMYPLRDTTEARYGEIARKMLELNDWVTPWFDYGVPFWGKPPLSFWITAISFKFFGVNEFAARFPHWLAGLFVGWIVWDWVKRYSPQQAIYVTSLLVGSLLFFISAGAVMTDMSLLIASTLAMRGFWLGLYGEPDIRHREKWLFFIGLGIGLLAKGPLIFVLVGLPLAVWVIITRRIAVVWRELPWIKGILLACLIGLPWYVLAEIKTPGFLNYFLVGEHWHRFITPGWKGDLYGSAHSFPRGSIWGFYFADLLPWSVLLPLSILYWWRHHAINLTTDSSCLDQKHWSLYLLLWALMPAVFFTGAGNILWPYVLPGFPALAMWTAAWLTRRIAQPSIERLLIIGLSLTLAISLLALISLTLRAKTDAKSAKALVASYQAHQQNNEALLFINNRSFSASFYTHGKAEHLSDYNVLSSRFKQHPFVVFNSESKHKIPENIMPHLTLIDTFGSTQLFQAHP